MSDKASSAANQQETLAISQGILRDYTPDISRRISKKLASLLGILFTDASVSPKEKNSWRISLGNTSEALIELFRQYMIDMFGLLPERVRIKKGSNSFFTAVVNSKKIGEYLVSRFGTFRTLKFKNGELPGTKIPVEQLIADDAVREFLRTAFSCDGGLCFYPIQRAGTRGGTKWLIRTVFLACHHPRLREDYITLLQSLGITARNVLKDGKVKIEREEDIRKFAKLVGFVERVKVTRHSKFWQGHEKQNVLNLMISSYKNLSLTYNSSRFVLR